MACLSGLCPRPRANVESLGPWKDQTLGPNGLYQPSVASTATFDWDGQKQAARPRLGQGSGLSVAQCRGPTVRRHLPSRVPSEALFVDLGLQEEQAGVSGPAGGGDLRAPEK